METTLVLSMVLASVQGFNFDLDFPIVFRNPEANAKAYFGYAVAMYPGNDRGARQWIRIGAPKANDSSYRKTHEPGLVYNCEVMVDCKPMSFPHTPHSGLIERWRNGWIGATMDVSYSNERFAVCGFRHFFEKYREYLTMGACFYSYLNSTKFHPIWPLLDQARLTTTYGDQGLYLYGQGQAGFSAHFPEGREELLLGAPGIYNWAGSPFRVSDDNYNEPDSSRRRRDVELFKKVEIPSASPEDIYSLFGYSVTSGHYYGPSTLYYVTASPKADQYKGKVVVFIFNGSNRKIEEKEYKIGEQFGEYFGGSLVTGRINDDKFDDLLVGSPYYPGKTFNEGKVYLYLGATDKLIMSTVLTNGQKGSQFGAAIMYLGDINGDGFGDVAVGAPYENGRTGCVYIFKGTNEGLQTNPVQKIIGKDIMPDLLGFGITISKAVDMDYNGYKDISIGAHLSDSVVFLRSRPLVVIRYIFNTVPEILSQDARSFVVNICFSYRGFRGDSVALTYALTMEQLLGRANIGGNITETRNITIRQQSTHCREINVTIKETPKPGVKTIPLKASVTYALNYPVGEKSVTVVSDRSRGVDKLCVRCPVLDEYRSNITFYETEIPFSLDCGSDNECQSFLTVDLQFPDLSDNVFVVGSTNYLKLKAIVVNTDENAYSTRLFLELPKSIFFTESNTDNASLKVQDVANPLKTNETKVIDLELDVRNANKDFDSDRFDIFAKVITSSNNSNEDSVVTTLTLKREADITIYGTTQQESNFYGNSSYNTSSLQHTFKIEKYGVSPLERLLVEIRVPFEYENRAFLSASDVETYFGGQPFPCDVVGVVLSKPAAAVDVGEASRRRRDVEEFSNGTGDGRNAEIRINDEEVAISNGTLYLNCSNPSVKCFDVRCIFGPYDKENTPASVQIDMLVNTTMIADMAKKLDMVLISSYGKVFIESPKNFEQSGNRADSVTISSVFINDIMKHEPIALWIIILAAIIGLLLLLLLILICIKIGFFKRSKKEELEHLKAAVSIRESFVKSNVPQAIEIAGDTGQFVDDVPFAFPLHEEHLLALALLHVARPIGYFVRIGREQRHRDQAHHQAVFREFPHVFGESGRGEDGRIDARRRQAFDEARVVGVEEGRVVGVAQRLFGAGEYEVGDVDGGRGAPAQLPIEQAHCGRARFVFLVFE
ncbi:unnamed protein product [Phyllotreta striolata]|uniref:Uncharacterized protein n=1 Tax=Phyllotreta striolata TaxID=444603 RepID=A0A9N9XSE6_PHYSR|nr:unnamed protein product [Phyllotreta striolata]